MPGAWENRNTVLIGLLTRGIVSTRWALNFRGLQFPQGSNIMTPEGEPYDSARNRVCQFALEKNYSHVFFLDDDVCPILPDTIARLMAHKMPIVSGLYYRRSLPLAPVAMIDSRPRPTYLDNFVLGSLVDVDLLGAGCLLIERKVLETMKKPWFQWLADEEALPEIERCSEDFAFCRKATKMGYRLILDTGIQCTHIGLGKSEIASGGKFTPL